jgi:flavin reductase (DIM6/NTAB) family NADH-FMN oxidoreductase RutF
MSRMPHTSDRHKQMVAALGRIASGLFVLTARRQEQETGMLASWVQQCAFEPPEVTVAIRRDREILSWLTDGGPFTLNILDDSQTDMISHFGRGFVLSEPAFTDLEVERPDGGAPVLTEALGYLTCEVAGRCRTADHELLIARVTGGRLLSEGHPMVHVRKSGAHY